ncbi:hypothetical protein QZH41_012362 [Actinostola sp. cb2023]|nr:hypothetical protein QZH41_012362 [Actinostola sp. cb2023]
MAATVVAAKTGNVLAKERKKEQEDSTYVFPKLANISRDMILQHQVDDTYSKSSYSKAFEMKHVHDNRGARPRSSRRNRPHPRKDWLMWRIPEKSLRKIRTTEDAGLWNWPKNDVAKDPGRYGNLFSHSVWKPLLLSNSVPFVLGHRLLNREEVAKAKLPAFKDSKPQAPTLPSQLNNQSCNAVPVESYSDLNKFLGSDLWKDKEVLSEVLDTADKRYLIKFLNTLSPETLLGLKKWLLARDEGKIGSQRFQDETEATLGTPPTTPLKDQNNEVIFFYRISTPVNYDAKQEPISRSIHVALKYQTFFFNVDKETKPKLFSLPEDKKFVKSLLEGGDQKQIEQFLSTMIQPDAITGVTHWLVNHEGKDREVALRFLGEVHFQPSGKQIARDISRENLESPLSNGRRFKKKRSPHGKNCSCSVCDADHSNKILRALYKHGTASVINEMRKALEIVPRPKRTVTRQQNHRKNQVPMLGGDNLVRRGNPGYVANKNALFMQPHRVLPSFFVIHPELP